MSWKLTAQQGLHLPQIGWWLDAREPVARSFVSHAHFDHLGAHAEILCSEGTARLMRERLPGERREGVLPFGVETALMPDCTVTLHPAGHIFGSAQALFRHREHGTLLYTGDFKLRPGRSAERCATPAADVLVMETTFGKPEYVFPPTDQVIGDLLRFCRDALADGDVPVLLGYSLGKSQELLCSLADQALPVMLHPATHRLTAVYASLGVTLPAYRELDPAAAAGHVVICPPQAAESSTLRRIGRRRTAVLSGWALDPPFRYRYQADAAFPLSDHADFNELLAFVDAVRPRLVYTVHGFCTEFAQTLRSRGIEAWAFDQANQLTLPGLESRPTIVAGTTDRAPATKPAATARGFARWARVADAIAATQRKSEKVQLLATYLAELGEDEAALAAVYFTGRPFAHGADRPLALGSALIRRAVVTVAGVTDSELRAAYRRFADTGEAAAAVLPTPASPESPELSSLASWFDQLADARGPVAKVEWLTERLRRLDPRSACYVIKIVTGDLRIGLKEGLVEEAVAAATQAEPAAIRRANLICGDLGSVLLAARTGRLDAVEIRPFRPLECMLASPEPTANAVAARLGLPVWLEAKYDGIRCQVHKVGERVEFYSRELKSITDQFPDLARACARLPGDFIADAELLAWRKGRALPFADLQRRLGRSGDDFFLGAEIPVALSCFDLLWRDQRSLLTAPLRTRRAALAELLSAPPEGVLLAPVREAADPTEIEAAFLAARADGNEGLMAKDPASPYTPGRRGLAWIKLKKAYATLDVVVVAVELGHGRRRQQLSDYTFAVRESSSGRLLTVGKAYTGLTDAEIAELTAHFQAHTLEERGRRRTVVPNVVIEVAFDAIQPSARHESGYALRFPRIHRLRPDKTVDQIDTLDTCRRLAAREPFPHADRHS